tara:strand:+ start:1172 stop:2836 length:1665 start_codon:yes stop_codon:yes gene_type:complete
MKNNKKIVIEDSYQEFNLNKSRSQINFSFNRSSFILFLFFLIFIIFSLKVLYFGSIQVDDNIKPIIKENFRSDIIDRNGQILAKSILTTNIGIDPKNVINKEKLLLNLKIIFPNKNFEKIKKKLNGQKFFYLEKKINPINYEKIFLLGDKSFREETKITRIYPQSSLFSHVLGQIDDNNNGISGIERSYDYELRSSEDQLILTVDTNIQHLIRQELIYFEDIFNFKGSSSVLMDIHTGEILSMVSLPDFDLNKRQEISDLNFINRATKGVYEFGSVFKTFTLAAALQEKILNIDTQFENLEKKIWCAGNPISEYDDDIPSNLTAQEILIRSGNIGSVRIAQKLGIDKFKNFLIKLGLLNKLDFDIQEVGDPGSLTWGKCKLATTSFGHGITTTLINLAKAYAIISNGGTDIEPTLIKKKENREKKKRILDKKVSEQLNLILRKVVSSKEGTAGFANISGYEVGGKTGTAQKVLNGDYTKEKVNTFVSIFPSSKPKFVLIILLDEPKPNKEYIYEYKDGSNFKYKGNSRNTAGWTSVEVAGKIIEKIGPILATKY